MPAPRERMLRLLSLLQTGRPWPAGELATATGANPRTLRRDVEHLRALGYPVRSARGPGGHYRLVAGAALPPLMLEDDEAVATVLGLKLATAGGTGLDAAAEAAERAAAKLRRVLPGRLRRRADEILAAVEIGETTSSAQASQATLGALATAVAAHRRVELDHAGRQGPSRRAVEPHRLVRLRQRWYLFAWDLGRGDWRAFRLDRIGAVRTTDDAFAPRPLPAADVAAHLRERFRDGSHHRVVLTLHAGAHDVATRLHRVDGTLHPLGENRCRYVAHVDSYEWLATVLVLSDVEFAVDEPAAFGDYLERAARRLLRAVPSGGPPRGTARREDDPAGG